MTGTGSLDPLAPDCYHMSTTSVCSPHVGKKPDAPCGEEMLPSRGAEAGKISQGRIEKNTIYHTKLSVGVIQRKPLIFLLKH